MRKIKLMVEYGCWPLWEDATLKNPHPNTLPISEKLQADLTAWSDLWQDAYVNTKKEFYFKYEGAEEKEFIQKMNNMGNDLLKRLQVELPSGFEFTLHELKTES